MHEQQTGLLATRVAVGMLLVIQVLHGVRPSASEFERSYWLVTYEHGFIRRGLGGEALRHLAAGPDETALGIAVHLTSWLPAVLLVLLCVRLLAQTDRTAHLLALLLAASPVALLSVLDKHRPDQVGLALLVALVLARGRGWAVVVLSLLLGLAVLMHEGSLVMFGVFALPVLVARGERSEWIRGILFFVPAGVATLAVLVAGRANDSQVAALLEAPRTTALLQQPGNPDLSILPYLGDSLRDSMGHIAALPAEKVTIMLVWGALVAGLHVALLAHARVRVGAYLPWVLPLVGLAVLHATGVDWQRWVASSLLATMVVLAGRAPSATRAAWRPIPLAWWLVALYLVSRPAAPSVAWRTGWEGFWTFWLWPVLG